MLLSPGPAPFVALALVLGAACVPSPGSTLPGPDDVDALRRLIHHEKILGRVSEARSLTPRLGQITDFLVLGSLENDQGKGFRTAYPNPSMRLAKPSPGRGDSPLQTHFLR